MTGLKRLLPRSIFGRSLLIVLTPMVILQIVMLIVFYERHWENVTRYLARAVAGDIAALVWIVEGNEDADALAEALRIGRTHLAFQTSLHRGASLSGPAPGYGNTRVERLLGQALERQVGRPFVVDPEAFEEQVLVRVQLDGGVLDVRVPQRRLESRTTDLFVFWMIGTSVVLALIAAYFVRQQIRPIRLLASAAEKFGRGIVDVGLKPSGAHEVRQAMRAFLAMRERVLRQIEQRTLMLAGVSHDLRTPLTRMKLELELLEGRGEVASLKDDIRDMEHMIEAYLAFAEDQGEEPSSEIDLAAVIRLVAAEAPGHVDVAVPDNLALSCRANALKRCLTNLVENACRYGSEVRMAAKRSPSAIQVTIDDNGPGIPGERREEALQPFVRLDDSRDPNLGGNGLGLTIANDIARGHGGAIELGESPSGGLRARVVLPT